MSSYSAEDSSYITMISNFRISDLQALLGAFNRNKNGRKSELKDRAIELLRSRPVGFNYKAYLAKISELNRLKVNGVPNNDMLHMMQSQRQQQQMMSNNVQQLRMYEAAPPNCSQQSIHISRGRLPPVMPQMQRSMYASSIPGNNMRYNNQPAGPGNIAIPVPTSQQVNTVGTYHLQNDMSNENTFTPSTQSLANTRLKKSIFYEVVSEVIKPTILDGHERCSLPNTLKVKSGMREATFIIDMSLEQINYISLNRDLTQTEYIYQLQIRICLLKPTSIEITDFFPNGLHIRVNEKLCGIPTDPSHTSPETQAKKIARPIDCTKLLKLNPNLSNIITVNWIPDGKTYVIAAHLVKKLSVSSLLLKLNDKGARSSDETKDYIIKKLADVDPDLTTTSYRFSLVCPLGKIRMRIPAKSINCDHLQCFDASTFISMNEKRPTWLCPTCNNPCLFDDIQIQTYFLEVVSSSSLPDSCKEIEILADGTWRIYEKNKEPVENAADKEIPMDSVTLDDSDDENSTDVKKGTNPESSNKETDNLKTVSIDLTMSDEEIPMDSVTLDDSDDENSTDVKKGTNPESSNKETDNLKTVSIDLTMSDEEEPPKDKDKQENEAQAADAVQPATTVDLKQQAQVQPQQAITSFKVVRVVVKIDNNPSPPTTLPPSTTTDF